MSKIPRNVFVLGLVSFFNDLASEMIYPLVPIFLTVVLGVPATILGLIEGIAEATASLMKFISGYISDLVQILQTVQENLRQIFFFSPLIFPLYGIYIVNYEK